MFDLYKWLWQHIGGRPWTYILRDLWEDFEFGWIVVLVTAGILLGHYCSVRTILVIWLSWCAGYIMGHIFWGTPHVPGQTGNGNGSTGSNRGADWHSRADRT